MSETETLSIEIEDKIGASPLCYELIKFDCNLLAELDDEIEKEAHSTVKQPSLMKSPKSKWWLDNLRKIGKIFRTNSVSHLEESIICRICELRVGKSHLELHLKSCSELASCLDRLSNINEYCRELASILGNRNSILDKLVFIEGTEGKKAIVKLAKLQYKLAKYSSNDSFYKRAKYLIEQKKNIAERIQELLPDVDDGYESSSVSSSSSSLIRSPSVKIISKRKGRMTSLLALILGRHKPTLSNRISESLEDFQVLKQLNRGAFGGVYLVKKGSTNDLFALKIMEKSEMIQKNMVANVLLERKILMLVKNAFVVRLFYAFQTRDHLILVLEWMSGGDLAAILRMKGRLDRETTQMIVAELVFGLGYLHENDIVHRDVKPSNILIDEEGHVKLTDFGLAETMLTMTGRVIGTPDYMAPEVITGKSQNSSIDWWSVGCVLFEMLVGAPPFIDSSPEKIFSRISNHETIDWSDLPPNVQLDNITRDLIDWLLKPKANDRPSQGEIMTHGFFTGVDWNNLRASPSSLKALVRVEHEIDENSYVSLPFMINNAEPMTAPYPGHNDSIASIEFQSSRSSPLARSMNGSVSSFDSFTNFRNYDLLADLTLQGENVGSGKERSSGF